MPLTASASGRSKIADQIHLLGSDPLVPPKACGVREQVANGHRPRRRLAAFNPFPFELRQVFLHRIVQLQLSLFNQDHEHACQKGFGDRCDRKQFVRCERPLRFDIGISERLSKDDFSLVRD